MNRLPVLALALWLAGCATEPVSFYTLLSPERGGPAAARAPYLIEIAPVDTPVQVKGPQMVLRRGDGEILLMESKRWIAPVPDEIRLALSNDISRRLGTIDVYELPRAPEAPVYRIKVEVTRFESTLNRSALVEARWSARPLGGPVMPVLCTTLAREPVGEGYPALVEGHQRTLATIAGKISEAVSALAAGQTPDC